MKVRIKNGWLVATPCVDPLYPGIDIEYVADNDKGETLSRPRVLVEAPVDEDTMQCDELRCLCWNNSNQEDYTEEITLLNFKQEAI